MTRTDVLGIGCAAIDDIVYISGVAPTDGKVPVVGRSQAFGGLTATALVAAARLGANCRFAGMLGSDPDSIAVVHDLRRAGVVVSRKSMCLGARPIIRSTIITSVDRGTRAIYFDSPASAGAPPVISERTIRDTRVLLIDGHGTEGSVRATEIARTAGIPVVADFELLDSHGLPRLLQLVDHLILSANFARELTRTAGVAAPLRALWNDARRVVAITDGPRGCWVATGDCDEVVHVPAYKVDAVDTTGCGDVFHGAYAAALAFGYPILSAISFANVAAGLKAMQTGAREGLPSRRDVESRL
jgi:sugar/nucleoside kinase (ribokinase family)